MLKLTEPLGYLMRKQGHHKTFYKKRLFRQERGETL